MKVLVAPLLLVATVAVAGSFDAIDGMVDRWQASGAFSGAIVVKQGDAVLYERAAGWADPERGMPFAATTPTDGASLAKPFTALLVLMLSREGRIDLEAPVTQYVAEYPHGETRVRHLLAHSAGLPDYDAFDPLFKSGMPVTTSAMLRDLTARHTAPAFVPGTRFAYCNLCLDTLAVVVERVTGASFEAALRARIWRPAGIANAYVRPARLDAFPPGRATGYRWRNGRYEPYDAEDNEGFHGGSNVYASAREFTRFGAAFADRVPWLGAAGRDALAPVRLAGGATTGITLGGWYCDASLKRCYYTGHHRGYYSVLYWNSERRTTVAWVCNSTLPLTLRSTLERALVAAAEGRPPPPPPLARAALDDARLASLAGDHEIEGVGRVRVSVDGAHATLRSPTGVDYALVRVTPQSLYAPGVDAMIGTTTDGRLIWSSVFVEATGSRAR